ncbi:MAG: SirB1 family protein [Acidiferrobacterales bacterium]
MAATNVTAAERFKELVKNSDESLDLAEAALLIAQEEYPDLDITAYLQRLDEFAGAVRARISSDAVPENVIATMNYFLFKEMGFAGNTGDYYDPRNSFLNEVLDRRLGIPLTLSILYIEVGQRLGLDLEGISFPGHFLVKLRLAKGEVVLDPYEGGVSLSEEDLGQRLIQAFGGKLPKVPLARLLEGAPKKEILVRMLRNLKNIYVEKEMFAKALCAIDRILLTTPGLATELRDRALVYERLECAQAAIDDYRRYLELEPEAADSEDIRVRMIDLQRRSPPLH